MATTEETLVQEVAADYLLNQLQWDESVLGMCEKLGALLYSIRPPAGQHHSHYPQNQHSTVEHHASIVVFPKYSVEGFRGFSADFPRFSRSL